MNVTPRRPGAQRERAGDSDFLPPIHHLTTQRKKKAMNENKQNGAAEVAENLDEVTLSDADLASIGGGAVLNGLNLGDLSITRVRPLTPALPDRIGSAANWIHVSSVVGSARQFDTNVLQNARAVLTRTL